MNFLQINFFECKAIINDIKEEKPLINAFFVGVQFYSRDEI